jgi:Tfp pilus assembly PilM family ATPase
VIAAIPPAELFIDHIRMPKIDSKSETKEAKDTVDNAVVSKIKQKLPFESGNAMIKYIPAEEDNALVIAAERKIIDRHLAIYEKADLAIKSIGVWPIAMAKSYTRFFGRRQADIDAVVYLLDIEPNCTNVVICRHENLLLARSISLGANQLDSDEMVARFVLELDACRRHFASMYRKAQIERLVFLSGMAVDKGICVTLAKQLEMPAQMGDCLAAVEVADPSESGVDRRNCQAHWAVAFGLSLP